MKTTELYIEQVIIGLLVLTIAAAPWARELVGTLGEINIKEVSVFLGLAFLLGIPFDRFADTLSDRLERHHRLQFALDKWIGQKLPKPKHNKLDQDIFPEDVLRLKGLSEKDAVVNWIEYHRSRIRLARALAVYGPALTLSSTLAMSRKVSGGMPPDKIYTLLSAVAAGYIVWAIVASPPKKLRNLRALFGEQLPRTNDTRFLMYATKWYQVDETNTLKKLKRGGLRVWSDEWRSLVVPVLVLLAALWFGIEYGSRPNSKTAWVAGIGVLGTVISAWSWWRISTTYRSYLYDIGRTNPTLLPASPRRISGPNPTCIFCKIVERNAEASVIYEDDRIMAFMTLRQINPGEFLIIPKEHIDHFCDLPDDLSGHITTHAQRLSRNLRERLKPQRVGLVVHGYGVPHAHLVVVPLHDESDIVSAKYAYIEDGQVKFSEELVPEASRSELDRLAQILS